MDEVRKILQDHSEGFSTSAQAILALNELVKKGEIPKTSAWAIALELAVAEIDKVKP